MAKFEDQILSIAKRFADEIAAVVKANIIEAFGIGGASPKSSAQKPTQKNRSYNYPEHCIYPNCSKQHGGPRSSFLCEEHRGISKGEKQKLLAARRTGSKTTSPTANKTARAAKPAKKKRKLTPEVRERLSKLMKARWAKRKSEGKKSAATKKPPKKAAAQS